MSHSTRRTVALWWTIFSYGLLVLLFLLLAADSAALADQIRLVDGTTIEADEAWEDAQGVWYRRSGVTHLLARARVRTIVRTNQQPQDPGAAATQAPPPAPTPQTQTVRVVQGEAAAGGAESGPIWIHLVGGARVEADEASETPDGVWYRHGNISAFIERARITRIERESAERAAAKRDERRERGWSSGRPHIDALIRQNGAAYGVDPYLIFLVMEQESHFNTRAVSPRGARGLMQLMPGTARRFGVRNPYDPAQNIRGGTRYLKDLMQRFGGRVDLVLASYNAGEGAVKRYGRVPPYRETRNYVKRISQRYQRGH